MLKQKKMREKRCNVKRMICRRYDCDDCIFYIDADIIIDKIVYIVFYLQAASTKIYKSPI